METWPPVPIPCVNVTISNNLGHHTGTGVASWGWEGYYSEIKIFGNTFWDTTGAGISFNANTETGQTKLNECRNNVFYITNRWWAGSIAAIDKPSWSISSNVWFGMSTIPLLDTGSVNTSVAFPAGSDAHGLFAIAAGCNGNLTRSETSRLCFMPKKGGPLDGKGVVIPSVTTDFFDCTRPTTPPCIGFAERECNRPPAGGSDDDGNGDDTAAASTVYSLALVALAVAILLAL